MINIVSFVFLGSFYYYYYCFRLWVYFFLGFAFLGACFLISIFNKLILWYQFLIKIYTFSFLNISYIIGIDGFSMGLVWISIFIILLCLLYCWYIRYLFEFYIWYYFFHYFV